MPKSFCKYIKGWKTKNHAKNIKCVHIAHAISFVDVIHTGKSFSEALIFASTNPQYDDRLFIELQVQYMKIPSSEHGENILWTEIVCDIQNNFYT